MLSALAPLALAADPYTIAPYPLSLASSVKPNLMVIFDNSQSMDATMGGKVISGNDPSTRANIARSVLRSVIDANRYSFNWGLTTFETKYDALYNTQAYYLGDAATMVYTNTCVNGVSNVAGPGGNLRCLANPYPANGFNFITYFKAGDDSDVNDVFYTNDTSKVYGLGKPAISPSTFRLWPSRNATTGWADGDFTGTPLDLTFTPTDAGFFPSAPYTRALFLTRGWGYYGDITGLGKIVEPVQQDNATHFNRLQSLLANETNFTSAEIKNSALYTPLAGSLQTVRDYYRGAAAVTSPITESCQSNYVVLATDGNPTGRLNGTQYDPKQWDSTYDAAKNTWTFGVAQEDVFTQIKALFGTTTLDGTNLAKPALANQKFEIKTYVIGMGDTVANPKSVAALNEMARLGNAYPTAFLGSSTAQLQTAFQTIVGDVLAKPGAAASVALNTGNWTAGSSIYQAKFNSADWSGDLLAFPVSATGVVGTPATWSAAARVKAQNWDTGRNIVTYKPSGNLGQRGIRFRWPADPAAPLNTELDVNQSAALNRDATNTTDGFGAARLAWLRGDPSRETRNCATPPCAPPLFRNRPATPLGDIINSAPYYVAAPAFGYADDFEAVPYSTFVSARKSRTPVVYVGANDGMLHAFDATTGNELFGYVPAALYAGLPQLSSPAYGHQYYADGSPTVGDVYYNGAWHTLLVAGMRAGAKGVFALDVTDPASFTEGSAASVVRWEFQDPDLGYVFGQPLIVKTNNGRWSVIFSGGYTVGNTSGRAMLFVLDAETGALVAKIDTGAGTAASPNGLSSPAAVDSTGDGIVDLVYAGDLNGNLWKFDLLSATTTDWGIGNGGAALFTTPAGQPITARPDVSRYPRGALLIGFGTGRYFAVGDHTSTGAQAVYAIVDNGVAGTVALTDLQQQSIVGTAVSNGVEYRLSTHAVNPPADALLTGDNVISRADYLSTKRGWYINLPTSGERVVADARFRGGRLVLVSLIPNTTDACSFGGTGWLLEYDAITGNRLDSVTFDTNDDKTLTITDYVVFPLVPGGGSTPYNVSGRKIGAISAAPGVMGADKLDLRFLNKADGTVETVIAGPGSNQPGRAMWREVQ